MKNYRTLGLPLFLSSDDETNLVRQLRTKVPSLRIVDGQLWPTASPPVVDEIGDCQQKYVYLWCPEVCSSLPYTPMQDGRVRGPASGIVIQFGRSRQLQEHVLTSGELNVGYYVLDDRMAAFVNVVWQLTKRLSASKLMSVDLSTRRTIATGIREYIVGEGARDFSLNGGLLKHQAADVYYVAEPHALEDNETMG